MLREGRLPFGLRKGFLTVSAAQRWKEIPWEAVSTPSLEKCKQVSDSHMGWEGPGGGLEEMPSKALLCPERV